MNYKGYNVQHDKDNPKSITIKNAKVGGSLPVKLSGLYTDYITAKEAIDAYTAPKTKE